MPEQAAGRLLLGLCLPMACRRIDEGFWRQSSSGRIPVVKRKRRRTLAPAKRKRLAAGAGGGRHHSGRAEGEGEDWEGSEDEEGGSSSGGDGDATDLASPSEAEDLTGEFDDADAGVFEERRASFLRRRERQQAQLRRRRLRKAQEGEGSAQPSGGGDAVGEDLEDELSEGEGSGSGEGEAGEDDVVFEGGFRLPADLYGRLFDYQRTAVKWMWELHTQRAGGIIGGESVAAHAQPGWAWLGPCIDTIWLSEGAARLSPRLSWAAAACFQEGSAACDRQGQRRCVKRHAASPACLSSAGDEMGLGKTIQVGRPAGVRVPAPAWVQWSMRRSP